jgi:hypothetical protein
MPFLKEAKKLFRPLSKQSWFAGTPGKYEQKSTLGPEQQGLYQQMQQALQGQGAGGAFGQAADYYRGLLSDDSADFQAFAAPEQRRFREETIPGLSEQFAGMGSGGLSSSGFRNAAVNAGTDLSERLGSIRAQLRQQGAQGLNQMGQFGLGNFNENIYRQGQPGLVDTLGQGLGIAGAMYGGPGGAAMGNAAGNWLSSGFGRSNPYGNQAQGQPG